MTTEWWAAWENEQTGRPYIRALVLHEIGTRPSSLTRGHDGFALAFKDASREIQRSRGHCEYLRILS